MGVSLFCFGQLSPQRLPKEDRDDDQSHCLFMKLGCFLTKKQGKERQMHQNDQKQKDRLKVEERTLEDWLLAEQPTSLHNNCINGGEYYVFKHVSYRVYPSVAVDTVDCASKVVRDSFSMDRNRMLKGDEAESRKDDVASFSSCMSQSGKSKKKVSFRLPEEANVFISHSPEEDSSQQTLILSA